MYEEISKKQVGQDLVILFLYHRPDSAPVEEGRYVFKVEGRRASGMGQVGAGVSFVRHHTDSHGVSTKARSVPDDVDSVPDIQVYADAHCLGRDTPDEHSVTLNGAVYEFGRAWERHPGYDNWHVVHGGLVRVNGKMTDAGHDRIVGILDAARDLFMAIPDVEEQLIRRALTREAQTHLRTMEEKRASIQRIKEKLDALDENGERA